MQPVHTVADDNTNAQGQQKSAISQFPTLHHAGDVHNSEQHMDTGICIRRVYEEPSADDGLRVLVDRLWPRGKSKQNAHIDVWLKDIAPSKNLRTWFGHIPERFDEFASRYRRELDANTDTVNRLRELIADHPRVTLLYGAKDSEHNNAVVLREYLLGERDRHTDKA